MLGFGTTEVSVKRVRYAVAFDWLTHRWLVRPDIEKIFKFRAEALTRRFLQTAPSLT